MNASKGTGTRPDDGTGAGTDLDTIANSASAIDCHSGKGACREIGGRGTAWVSRCFREDGQQVSQQSLIARRQQFYRSETQEAKTTSTKFTTHDNGNIVRFNQGNDDNSEELHQLSKPEKLSALEVKEARTTLYSLVQQHHLAEFQLIRQGKRIPRNSNLLSLWPFFDNESNLTRVGGRLANSPNDINKSFRCSFPGNHQLTNCSLGKRMKNRFIEVFRWHSTPFDKQYGYQEASRWPNKQFIKASPAFDRVPDFFNQKWEICRSKEW